MSLREPADHLPLSVPVYQILLSLTDRVLHGYAILEDVRSRTAGEVDLTASTLYGAVKRLLGDGLIDETDPPATAESDDPRRRYYAITPGGHEVLAAETRRLRRALRDAAAKGLGPSGHEAEIR
jgi:DNA-binding PadR family transcriptional regulator